ncbi:MAG: hypothetical protein M1134_07245 [Actinobacteria bacterium]|nr:hypothetical protein [Actinomycetota bacterium]MCL5444604.1 hypothetical protein [Actinomycetota bacterium]
MASSKPRSSGFMLFAVASDGSAGGIRKKQLQPDPVPFASRHPSADRSLFIVAGEQPVARLRIEARVIFAGPVGYPTLNDEITAYVVGVEPQVIFGA